MAAIEQLKRFLHIAQQKRNRKAVGLACNMIGVNLQHLANKLLQQYELQLPTLPAERVEDIKSKVQGQVTKLLLESQHYHRQHLRVACPLCPLCPRRHAKRRSNRASVARSRPQRRCLR